WRDKRKAVFFLDEIQVVPNWELFARRLLDTEKIDLFLSGSSARLLSREVATSMRGRAMEALVHPFSFREYLRYHGREPEGNTTREPKASRSKLERDLREYLSNGGFPEAMGLGGRDRFALLQNYIDVAILRDVIERYDVSNPQALRWMVRQLLGNAAGEFSISKFYNDLKSQGLAVSRDTLHFLLGALGDAFLVRIISLATDSERKRMVNPRKAYPIDMGLIPVFDRSGKENRGKALETCVLLELERRGAEIAYVKTQRGYEVDFLARYPEGRQELIQVCAELDDPETAERELRALQEAAMEHRRASLHLITLSRPTTRELPKAVRLHMAADWLLQFN
ncbi:MAG TPA: ATP-binding protein, partial [bacterium]|nr:ATP-binding protein [bacterium]